ncbi:hypothetical protein H9Q69_009900 [Fusarium xylarioides]|uniref:DUF7580 domain-containing protein n=1 Tax=Fusarium xylarioides TaxID=221167 RepID=A0A9P7KY47_9HYPO|nr:hypothetical protein H9Q70_009433 [Fusarium xylarioides]KAG5757846.1 hypothetical protein H9Q72_014015 [Fusarium xylarioides]KAG5776939.1 hypothetical protein H9Q73_009394 [Fusarium xylarioides]KAG5791057.1 hypothetical protein H9Q69_009900 [Fusarium xylarioides]KAG5808858.1 hypothetical protein H9Q71_006697 [Fusarium xylarioides]
MDIFGTTVTVIHEIYTITVFIKAVVKDTKNYDADKADILAKVEHESLFLESFTALFFGDDGALMANEQLPINLKRDVSNILHALKSCLAEYGLLAAKHNLLVDDAEVPESEDASTAVAGKITSKSERFKSKMLELKDLKKRAFDWALFDKDKLLDILVKYNQWTERLRQTMSLMLLVSAVFGNAKLKTFSDSRAARNLGLQKVAKRQLLAKETPPDTFKALKGRILDATDSVKNSSLQVADYVDEWECTTKMIVEYREYSSSLVQATEMRNTKALLELKAPIRNLAWLLRSSPLSDHDGESINETTSRSMFTLECVGYIDQPDEHQAIFLYQPPHSTASQNQVVEIITLHNLIKVRNCQFSLGHRFFMAYALATTILNVHGSGWVHKNISSHGVTVFPIKTTVVSGSNGKDFDHTPYLTGWGFARPELGGTELLQDFEVEPNFYRHPARQGNPGSTFTKEHDIYALGVVLLEIGLWKTISELFAKQIRIAEDKQELPPKETIRKWLLDLANKDLTQRMGKMYTSAVLVCLSGGFGVESDDEHKTGLSVAFREKVVDAIKVGMAL